MSVSVYIQSYVTKFFGEGKPGDPHMKLCTVPTGTTLVERQASGNKLICESFSLQQYLIPSS